MARSRMFYVIWELGAVAHIVEGRPRNYVGRPFKSRLDAEEFAAWWSYHHPTQWPTAQTARADSGSHQNRKRQTGISGPS